MTDPNPAAGASPTPGPVLPPPAVRALPVAVAPGLAGSGEIPLAEAPRVAGTPPPLPPRRPKASSSPELSAAPFWPAPPEPAGRAWLATMVVIALLGLYGWMLSFFYAGAHGGVDQAAYLMTARLIAGDQNVAGYDAPAVPATQAARQDISDNAVWKGGARGYTVNDVHPAPAPIQVAHRWDWLRNRLSFIPASPFQFASRMCVMTEPFGPAVPDQPALAAPGGGPGRPAIAGKPAVTAPQPEYRIYAKYPFGFPLLAALGRWVGSWWHREMDGMYVINPLCTVLACYFAYFMFRQAMSAFTALIGVLWLMCNPLVLVYANDANSHATTLFCVCVGYWGLISWLRTQGLWRGIIGGLALGYACTIRYSEFLHVLPVAFAALVNVKLEWKRLARCVAVLAAWALPVAVLAGVCWVCFGSPTKTGYSYCNEDVGFGWSNLADEGNWETLIQQLNITGLFVLWPLALAGMFGMLGSAWRLGGILALWVLPTSIVYMLYYWAPGGDTNTGYLRFYVSVMPGLIFAGLWLLERALTSFQGERWAGLALGTLVGLGLLVVAAFVADGGPIATEGGLGRTVGDFAWQTPEALRDLVYDSWGGRLAALGILGLIAGMWIFDRGLIAGRMGLALGAGAITVLGCSVNLLRTVPQLETAFIRWNSLRICADNVRQVLPRGSVLISDDNLLHEFDSVGGWDLYSQSTFSTVMYAQSRQQYEMHSRRDPELDPNPLQPERLRFYMELLEQTSSVADISLGSRSQSDIYGLERAVIQKKLDEGRRVAFLVLTDPGDMGGGGGPAGPGGRIALPPLEALGPGCRFRVLWKWTVPPPPSEQGTVGGGALGTLGGPGGPGGGRGGRRGGGPGRVGGPGPRGGGPGGARGPRGGGFAGGGGLLPAPAQVLPNAPLPQGATYVLYEVVRPATTKPTTAAASAPASARELDMPIERPSTRP